MYRNKTSSLSIKINTEWPEVLRFPTELINKSDKNQGPGGSKDLQFISPRK